MFTLPGYGVGELREVLQLALRDGGVPGCVKRPQAVIPTNYCIVSRFWVMRIFLCCQVLAHYAAEAARLGSLSGTSVTEADVSANLARFSAMGTSCCFCPLNRK